MEPTLIPHVIDPKARAIFESCRACLNWRSLLVEFTLETERTPEAFQEEAFRHEMLCKLVHEEGFERLHPQFRQSIEKDVERSSESYSPEWAIHKESLSYARQGDRARFRVLKREGMPSEGFPPEPPEEFINQGEVIKRILPESHKVEILGNANRAIIGSVMLPPWVGDRGLGLRNMSSSHLDVPFLDDKPLALEMLPLEPEEAAQGYQKIRVTRVGNAKTWDVKECKLIEGKLYHFFEITIDPARGNAVTHLRMSDETHFDGGFVFPRRLEIEVVVRDWLRCGERFYPIVHETTFYGVRRPRLSATEYLKLIEEPYGLLKLECELPNDLYVHRTARFRASQVRVDEELGDAELDYEMRDGMRVIDTRVDPPKIYHYKREMTSEEWLQIDRRQREWAEHMEHRRKFREALVGQPAPPLRVERWFGSEPLDWPALRGRKVILYFFGLGCGPCIQGLSSLIVMQELTAGNPFIIGLHVPGVDPYELEHKIKEAKLNFPVALAALPAIVEKPGMDQTSFGDYGVEGTPEACLIDEEGCIEKFDFGSVLDLINNPALAIRISREVHRRKGMGSEQT